MTGQHWDKYIPAILGKESVRSQVIYKFNEEDPNLLRLTGASLICLVYRVKGRWVVSSVCSIHEMG